MTAWSTAYSARSAESQRQPHAHFHLRPRKPDLEPEQAGRGAFDLMAVHGKRVAYSDMDDLAERLRPLLAAYSEGA
jgi:diadenosine tetraphosphate (Ap4A) HIT family hydrolase